MLSAAARDERGINIVSMSTSEFVGALDSTILRPQANGFFGHQGALLTT
jgi:hypothetical protein